jgi:hypothetical protein
MDIWTLSLCVQTLSTQVEDNCPEGISSPVCQSWGPLHRYRTPYTLSTPKGDKKPGQDEVKHLKLYFCKRLPTQSPLE